MYVWVGCMSKDGGFQAMRAAGKNFFTDSHRFFPQK
jgi:hypothetical protein